MEKVVGSSPIIRFPTCSRDELALGLAGLTVRYATQPILAVAAHVRPPATHVPPEPLQALV
jgi:hypothetical protein